MAVSSKKLWTKDYVFGIGINLLVYIVHFLLMLWSTSYAIVNWGVDIGMAGLASGIFIVGALVARIPAGRYIDFLGRRKMLVAGTLLFFAVTFLYLVAPGVGSFMAIRFIHGLSFGMTSTAVSTVVAALIPNSQMGTGIGYFTLGVTLASAIGPYMAMSFVNLHMFTAAMMVVMVLSGIIFLLSLFMRVPERRISETERKEFRKVHISYFFAKKSLQIAFVAMVGGVCYSTVLSFLGEYANSLGMSSVGGTWFFICFAFTSLICRPIAGWLLDHKGGSIVIYPALVLTFLSMMTLALARTDWMLLAGGLLLGAGYGTLTAACHALSIHCAPISQIGVATSTYFVLLDLGIGVGPYLLGNLVNLYGFSAVYVCAAVLSLFGIAFYYIELGRHSRFTTQRMEEDRVLKLKEAAEMK